MTGDEVARARIEAHEKQDDERMERIEKMFADIWKAIDAQRGRLFKILWAVLLFLAGVILSLIGYIWTMAP